MVASHEARHDTGKRSGKAVRPASAFRVNVFQGFEKLRIFAPLWKMPETI